MASSVEHHLHELRQEWSRRHTRGRARAFAQGRLSESDRALLSDIVDVMDSLDAHAVAPASTELNCRKKTRTDGGDA